MNALSAAQSVYDATIKNLAGKEVELDSADALAIATFCATLAQAQAAQPRLIRIGGRVINLAYITDVDFDWKDYDNQPVVRILLAVNGSDGVRELSWGGNQREPVTKFLRELLQPALIAEIDVPVRVYGKQPQPTLEGVGPSPLDNF